MPPTKKPKPTVDEVIQLMRLCNVSQIRAELMDTQKHLPVFYGHLADFYRCASQQKK